MKYNKRIIKKEAYKVSTWSAGKTTEMYIYPETSNYKKRDFAFRISSATVELEESEFTRLEGVKRWITSLDGELKLTHDAKSFVKLKPFQVYEFDGQAATHSYGKVRDFNLMTANGAEGRLETIGLDRDQVIDISNKTHRKEFNIFFSPQDQLSILVEDEEILLEKSNLLIVEVDPYTDLSVKLSSKEFIKILHSRISLI